MNLCAPDVRIDAASSSAVSVVAVTPDLDRLGDEIAELAVHLDAATARLLDLIPRVRRARRVEQRLSLLRRLVDVARGPRAGRSPRARAGGPHPRRAA
jgi:hypothetical protein